MSPAGNLTPLQLNPGGLCPGVSLTFGSSVYTMYPWQLHDHVALPFNVIGIEGGGQTIRVRSTRCDIQLKHTSSVCGQCAWIGLSPDLTAIRDRAAAMQLPTGTNYYYMNYAQLSRALHEKSGQIKELKLKVSHMHQFVTFQCCYIS